MSGLLPINGLAAADVPARPTVEALRPCCCEGVPHVAGFGYYGGGFGPYRRCEGCGKPFAKTEAH